MTTWLVGGEMVRNSSIHCKSNNRKSSKDISRHPYMSENIIAKGQLFICDVVFTFIAAPDGTGFYSARQLFSS